MRSAFAASVAVPVAVAVLALPAAASGATISGQVTDGVGGLAEICVSATDASVNPPGPPVQGSTTDSMGNYALTVPAGTYKVRYSHCPIAGSRTWVPEWWNDKPDFPSANSVNVTAADATGVNAVLTAGNTISGTVTNGAAGIQNICVSVHRAGGMAFEPPVGGAQTDAAGAYTTEPVAPGQYKLNFRDCNPAPTYISEWFNDKPDFGSANAVDVSFGDASNVNAALMAGRTISGTVTNGVTGIQGICVQVFSAGAGQGPPIGNGGTDQNGAYTTEPLPAGQRKIQFRDCSPSPDYVMEWWNDKPDFMSANVIDTTGANATGRDAVLAQGNTISGTVTGGGGPLQNICVQVFAAAGGGPGGGPGFPVGGGGTMASGSYTTDPVPPGTYKVQFNDCRPNPVYVMEWWNDKPGFMTADPIDLTAGDATNRNADLTAGRTISGRVTDGTNGIQGICVNVFGPGPMPGPPMAGTATGADGSYTTPPVAPGSYKLGFSDCRPTPMFVAELWNDKHDFASADVIDLTAASTTGKDAVLALGRTISGTVTDGANPVQGICVNVFPEGGGPASPLAGPPTGANGTYTTQPLQAGRYQVAFQDCRPNPSLAGEWWNDKPDRESADTVDVTLANATNVNAALAAGRTISGNVSDGIDGIQGICVGAFDATQQLFRGAGQTDASGHYRTQPLPLGQYKLGFAECNNPSAVYIPEWWDDKPSFQTADVINLTGADATGRDAVLQVGHKISGKVTSNGGAGIPSICVGVVDAADEELGVAGMQTDANGNYTSPPLPDGEYKVGFSDCSSEPSFLAEWWNDKPDFMTADTIQITGAHAPGRNAVLAAGRTISGRVTGGGGAGIQGVCVRVVPQDDEHMDVGGAETNAMGDYRTEPVPPGHYKLDFRDCNPTPTFVGEWWNDKSHFAVANVVDLTSASATGIDASLAAGRTVSGRVTTNGTTGIPGICVQLVDPVDEEKEAGYAETDSMGNYTSQPVLPGSYKLHFDDCRPDPSRVSEWWNDKPDFQSATVIDLTTANATGRNAVLAEGRTISGRVTSNGTTGIAGICTSVVQAADEEIFAGGGETGANGEYRTSVLPFGHYKLQFVDCNAMVQYVSEWFDDVPDFAGAADIDLTSVNRTADAVLARGGGISGTVRAGAGGGPPLGEMCVNAQGADVAGEGGALTADGDGTYRIGGLRSGHYDVHFADCRSDQGDGTYVPQHVQGVTVTAPADTQGVDANMGSPDDTSPDTFITSGPSATTEQTTAVFTLDSNESNVVFSCRLDGGAWQDCVSPASFPGLGDGSHALEVRAVDVVEHADPSPASQTWTVASGEPASEHTTSGALPPAGGTVTNDPLGQGAGAGMPVVVAVTAPAGGTVTITEQPASGAAPAGYSFFGRQVQLSSSVPATAASPLRVVFTIDASLIPAGTAIGSIAVFRNGSALAGCAGASAANPDPCVLSRQALPGGDARVTVLTSQASTWNIGRVDPLAPPPPPAPPAPPPPPPADTTPPLVRLSFARNALRLPTVLRRGLVAAVGCDEPCSSTAQVSLSRSVAGRLRVPAVVARGRGTSRLVLRLSRAAKRAFTALRRVSLTLRVTTADAAGNRRITTRRVTLRR